VTLLLDAQVIVWWLKGDRRLGRGARRAIEIDAAEVCVSAASLWEIAIKAAVGHLEFDEPFEAAALRVAEYSRFRPLSITVTHALAAGALPLHHRDPFDRMLIAQAQLEELTIVTADAQFQDYEVELLDARL
jgi:PIN domain nuclease of toxin-antitoxin system